MKAEFKTAPPAGTRSKADIVQRPGNGAKEDISGFEAAVRFLLANIKLLVLGPIAAGIVAFGIVSFLPKSYTSVAYLNLDEEGARTADARMRSTPVIDRVLSEYKPPATTVEGRRRHLEENRRIVMASGESPKTAKLFRLEYSDRNAEVAQKVNSLLIEAWLASTQPPPERRAIIEAEIQRTDTQTQAITRLIERLEKDATTLVAQSLQGELATPILGLIAKRDENLATSITLKNTLSGVSRDVIFGKPDLPEEPSWPRRGIIVILTIAATALLLLIITMLHRFRPKWI
jgi:hypothetical protein